MTGRSLILPYGDRALLVELGGAEQVVAYAEALAAAPEVAELLDDVVPGARTVLLVARPGVDPARLAPLVLPEEIVGLPAGDRHDPLVRRPSGSPPELEVPVTYDGPDLAEVGERTGLGERGVVAAHTGTPWRVAFGGFAPGFAYLVGGDPRLHVPRRHRPRTQVPAGSVGLAGEFSGIYPRSSPGGWQLIGSTDLVLWDLDRDPPALLAPGARVRFVRA